MNKILLISALFMSLLALAEEYKCDVGLDQVNRVRLSSFTLGPYTGESEAAVELDKKNHIWVSCYYDLIGNNIIKCSIGNKVEGLPNEPFYMPKVAVGFIQIGADSLAISTEAYRETLEKNSGLVNYIPYVECKKI